MKRFFKMAGILALAAVLCGVALIGSVEFLDWRDHRDLEALVSTLTPGIPFSEATDRLGQPKQTIVNPEEMSAYRRSWAQTDVPGPKLNLFAYHRRAAFYWVLVFTDADSKTIQHAEWNNM